MNKKSHNENSILWLFAGLSMFIVHNKRIMNKKSHNENSILWLFVGLSMFIIRELWIRSLIMKIVYYDYL